MNLKHMTVTGADDDTNVYGMLELSKDYSFIEWGILFPLVGASRFPSVKWLEELKGVFKNKATSFAAHLCADDLDNALQNTSKLDLKFFRRIQLNFHGQDFTDNYRNQQYEPSLSEKATLFSLSEFIQAHSNQSIIFQLDGVNDWWIRQYFPKHKFPNVQYLFDSSSGAGILPNSFPIPHKGVICGFAGGLGPKNIESVLYQFKENLSPKKLFWIDMESQVRTDGELDLNKVGRCAESVAEIIFGKLAI